MLITTWQVRKKDTHHLKQKTSVLSILYVEIIPENIGQLISSVSFHFTGIT